MPLRTELKNGDHIEILTSPTARPNPSWLSFVATGKARSRIRHFLKGLIGGRELVDAVEPKPYPDMYEPQERPQLETDEEAPPRARRRRAAR